MEVKPGYSTASTERIPHDWDLKRIGSVIRFQVGYPFSSVYFNGKAIGIRLVKNRDLKSDDQVVHYAGSYDRAFLVTDGDVLIGMDGDFLPCMWAKGPALLNQRVGRIVPKPGMDRDFAYYCLLDPLKAIEAATAGTTVKHLSHGDIEDIEMPLPSATEQRAIAAALSDVDALLAGMDRLIVKKRYLKQAAMQQLLTGQTRLPGFQGEWEVKRLGDLGTFLKGVGVKKDESRSGDIPCVRYGEIYTHHNDFIRSFNSWISHDVASTATRLRSGDLLFAGSGETKAEIGKCVAFIQDCEAYAGGDIVILRPVGVDSSFMGYYCNTSPITAQKASKGQGDAVVHISAAALGSISVALPAPAEQAAIAAVLSDMDSELAALEARREKTRALKQGMMQELLTGRTRLV